MSSYVIVTICSHTAVIPAIVGVIRSRRVPGVYRPFLIVLVLGCINEIISSVLIWNGRSNAVNSNIYVLAEFLCVLLLFRNWGTHERRITFYKYAAIAVTGIWIIDNLILHSICEYNDVYRLCYSFLLVFLSVDQINHVVIMEREKITRNPKFIICNGLLLYYTFKTIVEAFFVFQVNLSILFYEQFMFILTGINVLTNGIYTTAILWMPTKRSYWVRY
jgi:small basic protein